MTPKEILKRLFQYARPYAGYLIGGLLCAVASIALTLLGPVLIGKAIDQIVGPGQVNFPETLKYLILLGITVALAAVFQWLMTLCTNKVTYYTVNDLRQEAFGKLHQVPLKYIDGNPHGDIINRLINDIDFISDGLLQGLTQLFTGVVTIVGTLCFMLGINPLIALVVVLVTPLSLFVAVFVAKSSNKMFKEQTKTQGELGGCVEEMLGSQKVVKAFSYEERAEEKFQEINARLYKCGQKAQFFSSLSNPSTRFVNGIVYAAAGVVGAISVINGNLSVGGVSSFLTYANQYTKPFNEVTGVITQLQTAFSSAGRVFALLDQPEEAPDAPDAKTVKSCEGRVRIDHVSFAYRKDQKLIENFNLETKPGQRIAIVGHTGCGKTTMINLLMRFYDVNQGEISVDGVPVKEMTRDSLRRLFGMVLQDTWLYSATVRENIAYGKPNATMEEIRAAAKAAYADGFIRRMPQGYDTLISEDGGNLSQGQKQLLSIARVMLVDPPMLILDEATSSIDTLTEIRVQKAFDRMMEGRTSFIVAHRLSTIKNADVILVMNQGNIIEQGSHQELLDRGGFYCRLYNSQFVKAE